MGYDYYTAARALANRLAAEGHADWAEKIESAMSEGATGTEIFMSLRWRLQQLRGCGDSLSGETREQIDALLKGLESALR